MVYRRPFQKGGMTFGSVKPNVSNGDKGKASKTGFIKESIDPLGASMF